MKFEHLTIKEILRIAEPSTEMERALFDKLESNRDELELYQGNCESCEAKDSELEDSECLILTKDDEIGELEDRVHAFESLLDENEIDYSEI